MDGRDDLRQRWLSFQNTTAEEIPAFGVMRPSAAPTLDGNGMLLKMGKPSTATLPHAVFLNGPLPVAAGKTGICTTTGPYAAATTGSLAIGRTVGPSDDSWLVSSSGSGLVCLADLGDDLWLVDRAPAPRPMRWGRTDAPIAAWADGTVTLWTGKPGVTVGGDAETETAESVPVQAIGVALADYHRVELHPVQGLPTSHPDLAHPLECEADVEERPE